MDWKILLFNLESECNNDTTLYHKRQTEGEPPLTMDTVMNFLTLIKLQMYVTLLVNSDVDAKSRISSLN